ncbi:hypothetical protein LTR85_010335 [Meristemomyces frigidus]|nr:hypothetical protein LTR85_010335 [Meristemomyces frigidus]
MGTVVVSFEEVAFAVHQDLICRHSQYFKGAFDGGFSETTNGIVVLKQESVKNFTLFLAWLYTGEIELPTANEARWYDSYERKVARAGSRSVLRDDEDGDKPDEGSGDSDDPDNDSEGSDVSEDGDPAVNGDPPDEDVVRSLLIDLFIFADRRGVPCLQNDIIDLFAKQRENGWSLVSESVERVGIAYSSLPTSSGL